MNLKAIVKLTPAQQHKLIAYALQHILAADPGRAAHILNGNGHASTNGHGTPPDKVDKRRKPLTAKQRALISKRMQKRWADLRAAQAAKSKPGKSTSA